MGSPGPYQPSVTTLPFESFHFATLDRSGSCMSWLVLTKKKYVSPGPYLGKFCPRLTCDRVRSWRPSCPIGWMWPMA